MKQKSNQMHPSMEPRTEKKWTNVQEKFINLRKKQ